MTQQALSQRTEHLQQIIAPVFEFLFNSDWAKRQAVDPTIYDFVVGNPHEMPLESISNALRQWSTPQNQDWFAYKTSEPASQELIAESLKMWRGVNYMPQDIVMTNGAFAGLSIILNTVLDPGDEVIFISPPWFFYELLITSAGGVPVRVRIRTDTFDLDLDAIDAAITPHTRAIIINSPNNPTGKIYPAETLKGLSQILSDASGRHGRRIFLLSDEAYSKIIYDNQDYPSPTTFYPDSFLIYTYGKTLLIPGQRLGYIALPPEMEDRSKIANGLTMTQLTLGFAFPNALLQHALVDLDKLSIDIDHLQAKRDHMVGALREFGYNVHSPDGTFYLMPKSPWADDLAFLDMLAEYDVYCLPGAIVELPGYFRISLTANDEMIAGGLPGFEAAYDRAMQSESPGQES